MDGGLSITKIAKKLNCSRTKVYLSLKRNKIPRRSVSESSRIYKFNESYFDVIDSHDQAQSLGFIAADGCIIDIPWSKIFAITLSAVDETYLDDIRCRIGWPNKIKSYMAKTIGGIIRPYVSLKIGSVKFCTALEALGITPRKSFTHEFPTEDQVPAEFLNSYILGYFEGDGCIYIVKSKDHGQRIDAGVNICVSHIFAEGFKNNIEKILGITVKIKRRGKISAIIIDGNKQIEVFLRWIYKDCKSVMERKRRKVETFLENRELIYSAEYLSKNRLESTIIGHQTRKDNSARVI